MWRPAGIDRSRVKMRIFNSAYSFGLDLKQNSSTLGCCFETHANRFSINDPMHMDYVNEFIFKMTLTLWLQNELLIRCKTPSTKKKLDRLSPLKDEVCMTLLKRVYLEHEYYFFVVFYYLSIWLQAIGSGKSISKQINIKALNFLFSRIIAFNYDLCHLHQYNCQTMSKVNFNYYQRQQLQKNANKEKYVHRPFAFAFFFFLNCESQAIFEQFFSVCPPSPASFMSHNNNYVR